jgi:hypothetical protein
MFALSSVTLFCPYCEMNLYIVQRIASEETIHAGMAFLFPDGNQVRGSHVHVPPDWAHPVHTYASVR